MEILQVRKLADKSPEALASHPADHPDKYPFAGLDFCDARGRSVEPPKCTRVSTGRVDTGVSEGWLVLEGERHVARPGGEVGNEWRRDKIHNFRHADAIVFKTVYGDVRYLVTHQPDKYVDTTDYTKLGDERVGSRNELDDVEVTPTHYAAGQTRVDNFYDLELEA